MRGYSCFASYYDRLTKNVGYEKRADYFLELLARFSHEPGLTLDLACGTGSLTIALKKRGVDVYGIDASPEMLSEAQQKAAEEGLSLLFLCQKMQNLDLYGTVDTVLCTLDSINHITKAQDVQRAFERVSLFLDPQGYFVFDVNTPYKHREVLKNNTFVYDTRDVYCVWQNSLQGDGNEVRVTLDFFERDGAVYRRSSEEFCERAYEQSELSVMLQRAGLTIEAVYDDLTFFPPEKQSERVVFVTRKG